MTGSSLAALPMEIMRSAAAKFKSQAGVVYGVNNVLMHQDFRHCVRFKPSIHGRLRISVSWMYDPPGIGFDISSAYHRDTVEFDLGDPDLVDRVYNCMRDQYCRRVSYDELQRTLPGDPLTGHAGDATPR